MISFVRKRSCEFARTTFARNCVRTYATPFDRDEGPKQYHAEKSPVVAGLWGQRAAYIRQEELQLARIPVESQNSAQTLLEKTPADSRLRIFYNFSTDDALRHLYIDAAGNVMTGKLFEDLDALAGNIAFRHCDDGNPASVNPNLVTVSVDKIIQSQPLSAAQDIVLFGQMAWVGTSSMDILIKAFNAKDVIGCEGMPEILDENGSKALMTSVFTFVARSGRAGGAVPVNKLIPSSPYEEAVFNKRKLRTEARKKNKTSTGIAESIACQKTITQLVERGSAMVDMPALAHPNAVLMKQTALENSFICQPQNVNVAGTIFGGFLMHRAYDIALATGYTFAGLQPFLLEVDTILFRRPVDIGDLVRLKSRVIYASDDSLRPFMHVEVTVQVVRPERASSFVSNTFHFIFGFSENVTLRRVLPVTNEEATVLLSASRHVRD